MSYAALQVTSNFSFLRGGSHPEELVEHAHHLGYKKIAITDHNTLAGIVRAHVAAKKAGIPIIPAARLDLIDGPSLLAYPTNRQAYASLSGLLTKGNLRTEKGKCELYRADVYEHAKGMKFMIIPPEELDASFDFARAFKASVAQYHEAFGRKLYIAAIRTYQGDDAKKLYRIQELANRYNMPMVATNDVIYHSHERRQLQDVLTCIREKCTIHDAGYRLFANGERYLKPVAEMERIFRAYPDAIARTMEIADACTFSLDELEYVYPKEITGNGDPQLELEKATWHGAGERYGTDIPAKIKETLRMELDFIRKKNYAAYFLFVFDIVKFARHKQILCQGRGSAANSVVCYCLGITSVDPTKFKLLFARFMSDARDEPPDIDVDFEHERREEVMQYIYSKYGRDRAGIVATVTQVHWKGAIRDVGKAMGLSVDAVDRLSKSGYELTDEWLEGKTASSQGFDPADKHLLKVLDLTQQYIGFPRQLGQHTGGFVVTEGKLHDLCPVINARMVDRTNIEWNKDDIEALGFLKVDVLALGMLTCIRKAFDLARKHYGLELTLASINEKDDPRVYEMISRADTLGVFQIESRAQMSMLPRLKPRNFYDLVIEVAIVRPGPIQGDMVHPYLRRRNKEEPVEYPSKELEGILGRTLGVPLFQEQAMEIAIVAAGFTPAEADGLRRSMATFKAKGLVTQWERKLISGMVANGYKEDFAKKVFKQLEGFGSYGFPESHAASFALLVYVSCWLKCYYPDVFATALLNSMPMGFYQPAQIVIDARKHAVPVRPVDVNLSSWDNTLEQKEGKYFAIRLGFRQVKGLRQDEMDMLVAARQGDFRSVTQLRDAGISEAALERLADADAFRSLGLDRRQALWEVSALQDRPMGMFTGQDAAPDEGQAELPRMSLSEHVIEDYRNLSLSLKAHPVSFLRRELFKRQVLSNAELSNWPDGTPVRVSGLVLVRQRPGTASGVCFITLEDETGIANLVVFEKIFQKYRAQIQQSVLLMVEGKLQKEGDVIHVVVRSCQNMNELLYGLSKTDGQPQSVSTPSRADERDASAPDARTAKSPQPKAQQLEIFPGGRNFR